MILVWLFAAASCFADSMHGPPFLAQSSVFEPASPVEEEGEDLEDDESGPEDDELLAAANVGSDLALPLTAGELRDDQEMGLMLRLGNGSPWQGLSLEFLSLSDGPVAWFGFLGGGNGDRPSSVAEQRAYAMEFTSRAFGGGARYFVESLDVISVDGMVGYCTWNGTLTPEGEADITIPEAELVTTDFSAHGPFVATRVSMSYIAQNGFAVDWTLVGLQKAFVAQRDITIDSSAASEKMDNEFGNGHLFGFTNIAFGYFF
jgi:hypothetical protein